MIRSAYTHAVAHLVCLILFICLAVVGIFLLPVGVLGSTLAHFCDDEIMERIVKKYDAIFRKVFRQ